MSELLPCPFCGGEASVRSVNGGVLPWVVEERGGVSERYYTTCTLWCGTCGAQIEGYAASDETAEGLYKQAIENCYNAWNTRYHSAFEETVIKAWKEIKAYQERTCKPVEKDGVMRCPDCDYPLGIMSVPAYCAGCGAKVVGE